MSASARPGKAAEPNRKGQTEQMNKGLVSTFTPALPQTIVDMAFVNWAFCIPTSNWTDCIFIQSIPAWECVVEHVLRIVIGC